MLSPPPGPAPLLTPAPLDLHAPTTQKRFSQQIRALPLPDRRLVKIQCRHRQRSQPAPSLLSRSPHPRLIPTPGSRFGSGIPASRRPRPPAGAHKTSEPLSTPGITVSLRRPCIPQGRGSFSPSVAPSRALPGAAPDVLKTKQAHHPRYRRQENRSEPLRKERCKGDRGRDVGQVEARAGRDPPKQPGATQTGSSDRVTQANPTEGREG